MMMYCCAQMLGGMIAGAFICFNLSAGWVHNMLKVNGSVLGYPNTNSGFDRWQAFIGELLGTMILLVSIVLATETWAHKPERKGHFAICIGLILTTCIYGIGNISGGALNPARMLGPMIVSGTIQTVTTPYIAGTMCGSIIGAFFYRTFLSHSKSEQKEDKEFDNVDGGKTEKEQEKERQIALEYEKQKAE